LPIHPVKAPKITKEKLKETAKKTDNPELQEIIQKAVSTDTPEGDCNIYVEKDGQTCLYQKDDTINMYKSPPFTLLNPPVASKANKDTQVELKQNSETLVNTLKSFGVQTRIVDINRGPSVTRYELQPAAGVKVSRITSLTDDIKMSLAAKSIRIEAPIPGKAAVGIEVPNNEVDIITMREMLETKEFADAKSNIAFALGKDITGEVVIADIAKMPHVLIAGATGSGKSVCINSLIISLLYKSSPDDVRLLMIDPKMVELEVYNGIPHLLIPVVTDPRKAAGALSWAVTEMQKRYKLFSDYNVRNLTGFNEMAKKTEGVDPLPQIVIIIDELADLMMVAAKDVEEAICRLAQLARAAGMHLVIATQRPSVDIITGVIKANIPTRIAFAVSSQIDSRTILDGAGAEKLLGRGDMLYSPYGAPKPTRIQGCFVSDKEVENVVSFIKNQIKADYDETIIEEIEKNAPVQKGEPSVGGSIDSSDEMIEKAIEVIVDAGQASTSYLQRRLKLGYARAARIMDELEQMGIIGPSEGAKPRAVLMTKEQWYEAQMSKE
jgi:S-DNA-T family DNA segregation ATPase FtsK/SpoIIIE